MGAPSPPDPTKTAQAQSKYDIQTAIAQSELNQTNQNSPFGSMTYKQTGTRADGTPIFESNTVLAPAQQALLDKQTASQGQAADIAHNLLGSNAGLLSGTPNLNE